MNILGGTFDWGSGGYKDGPRNHAGTGWKRQNAWDLETQAGIDVYSITSGRIVNIQSPSTQDPHLYGTSFVVKGKDGFPDVFYCNMGNVKVRDDEKISVGQKLGKVARAPQGQQPYLHVALPFGKSLSSLISSSGEILSQDSGDSGAGAEAAALAAGSQLSGGNGDRPSTGDVGKDVMGSIYSGLAKGLIPLGIASGIAGLSEEVQRIKNLMK